MKWMTWKTWTLALCLGLVTAAGCDRKVAPPATAPASAPAAEPEETSLAMIATRMNAMGFHFAKSPDDDRLTSFVADYMKKKGVPIPANVRYAVGGKNGLYKVMAMNIEAIRKQQPNAGHTFFLKDDNGQLSVFREQI
jgi:hypothetical protein